MNTQAPLALPLSPAAAEAAPPASAAPEVLRCTSTADFLAALPFVTGFTDQHSLFAMLFRGNRGGEVVRIDLPREQRGPEADRWVDGVAALLSDLGAGEHGPALVLMTAQSFAQQGGVPWQRLARRLQRRMDARGWPLRELAIVAADGWCSLRSADQPRRRPLSEIAESPIGRRARDRHGDPSRLAEMGGLPQPSPVRAAEVLKHLTELERRREARSAHPAGNLSEQRTPVWAYGAARVAEACFASRRSDAGDSGRSDAHRGERIEPRVLARLIDAAQCTDLWLVLAITSLTRAEFVVSVAEEAGPGRFSGVPIDIDEDPGTAPRQGWSIRRLLHSLSHSEPDPRKLRGAIVALEDATTHCPEPKRPALLALLAWAWWMRGMQSVAARLVRSALDIDAGHELALMVQRLVAEPPAGHVARVRATFDGGVDGWEQGSGVLP